MPLTRDDAQAGGAFATPSVVHFGAVLLLSAMISAPWKGLAIIAMLAGSACLAYSHPHPALFLVAAVVLLLLFIGIHNAWDAITWHVFVKRRQQREADRS